MPFAPPPLAVQSVALLDDQMSVKESPTVTFDALVCRLPVTASLGDVVTVSCACAEVGATVFAEMLSQVRVKVKCPNCVGPPGVYI